MCKINALCFLCFLLIQCNPAPISQTSTFDSINSTLQKKEEKINTDDYYTFIKLNREKNPSLALKADTLEQQATRLSLLIDSLQQVMQTADSAGERDDIASRILIHTKTGNRLAEQVLQLYNTILSNGKIRNNTVPSSIMEQLNQSRHWQEELFNKTPTVAAITILKALNNECTNATNGALQEIYQQLTEHHTNTNK
ncbi:GldM N-terminal domain-containing protein [Filimonas lacunae]|uniref:GldM N-terminal domain-containing protein n=1 Tax=Filimonas lacunae TaxID=477680 RepID=A0A173MG54_9BACT|nr:hypothetical protein [Filimonas lacunae]BAV06469.1 hypothetical protein FLA_2488 [Filimonas lacunae]SIT27077.1 GldM N-terminal domain-containing protein [Filimonas lacunae]